MNGSRRAGERSGKEECLLETSPVDIQGCYTARLEVNLASKRLLVLWVPGNLRMADVRLVHHEGTDVLRGKNLDAGIGHERWLDHTMTGTWRRTRNRHENKPDTNDLIVP